MLVKMLENIIKKTSSNPAKDYYYIMRDTPNNETVIVEYGFADSDGDVSQLKNNWENLAEAVTKAIVEYAGEGNMLLRLIQITILLKVVIVYGVFQKSLGVSVSELKGSE